MSEYREPLTVRAALYDLSYLATNREQDPAVRAEELERIAVAMAAAIRQISELRASKIGAGDHVVINGLDAYSFYQGAHFALARVTAILRGSDSQP